jgi:hypothetical protein
MRNMKVLLQQSTIIRHPEAIEMLDVGRIVRSGVGHTPANNRAS